VVLAAGIPGPVVAVRPLPIRAPLQGWRIQRHLGEEGGASTGCGLDRPGRVLPSPIRVSGSDAPACIGAGPVRERSAVCRAGPGLPLAILDLSSTWATGLGVGPLASRWSWCCSHLHATLPASTPYPWTCRSAPYRLRALPHGFSGRCLLPHGVWALTQACLLCPPHPSLTS